MTFDPQNALVLLAILAAGVYLARRVIRAVRLRGTVCHGCLGCPRRTEREPKTELPLVSIDPPRRKPS